MNILRQPCPSCNRILELPADAAGRLGQCPACDATFTIAQSTTESPPQQQPVAEPSSSREPPPLSDLASPQPASDTGQPAESPASSFQQATDNDQTWADSVQHPFTAPLQPGTVDADPAAPPPDPMMQPATPPPELQMVRSSIEEIVASTLSIFADRWVPLVLAFLIVAAVAAFVVLIPLSMISAIANSGGDVVAGLLALIWVPTLVVLSGFFAVGMARVALAVARNDPPSPLSALVPPLSIVFRFLVAGVLMALVIGAAMALWIALVAGLGQVSGNRQLAGLLSGMGMLVIIVVSLLLQWLLWSWLMIVSDGRGTMIGSVRSAIALTIYNKLPSALILLIAMVLSVVGSAVCGVGHIVTAPLTMLLYAVGYLKMTGQALDDPAAGKRPYEAPPERKPEF